MKNKAKLAFDLLEQEMEVIGREEQRGVMGGIDNPIVTQYNLTGGGSVESWNWGEMGSYSIVTAPDGSRFLFDGVSVTSGGSSAYTSADGVVHMGSGLTMNEFIHEYGHYLQSEEMSSGYYYTHVAPESVYKNVQEAIGTDSQYYATGYEYDASNRGNEYMNNYYPNSGYSAPTQ